jgi:hypothetical protein
MCSALKKQKLARSDLSTIPYFLLTSVLPQRAFASAAFRPQPFLTLGHLKSWVFTAAITDLLISYVGKRGPEPQSSGQRY